MKVDLHNKIEVFIDDKCYVFYNKMFDIVFEKISNNEKYFEWIAVGDGEVVNDEKPQKLSRFIKKYALNNDFVQNNIQNGTLFNKKSFVVDEFEVFENNITEIAICENSDDNPNIYNYITLISDELPTGIKKNFGQKLMINVYVYLEILPSEKEYLCYGENPILSLILGEGLLSEIYAIRGCDFSENFYINRSVPMNSERFLCEKSFLKNEKLKLLFSANLGAEETTEIVFVCDDKVVARINCLEFKQTKILKKNYQSQENNEIVLSDDIKEIFSVKNVSNNSIETDYFLKKYSKNLGDKINVSSLSLFNNQTARFLSKDGNMLFFVKDDYVYGYSNVDLQIREIKTGNLFLRHIKKIVSFEDYVFIFTKTKSCVHCYQVVDNSLVQMDILFKDFPYYDELDKAIDVEFVVTREGKLMFAIILESGVGVTVYFSKSENLFVYERHLIAEYNFSLILSVLKNSYCDSQVIFVQGGNYSYECRVVTHFANMTIEDVASRIGFEFTNNVKQIKVCGRTVVIEKIDSPKLHLFYLPLEYYYDLSEEFFEVDDYVSNDLCYLIQKYSDGSYKFFNLYDCNKLMESASKLSDYVDENKIVDFEFMSNCLLVFLNDEKCPLIAINFYKNKTILENLKEKSSEYEIEYSVYDKIGINEEVKATFVVEVEL